MISKIVHKHSRITSGEFLSNDRRAVGLAISQLGLRDASGVFERTARGRVGLGQVMR